ncbi:MAG: cyclic nucleotide-binding domain-containing protein [Elusimicrobiota bacterium]
MSLTHQEIEWLSNALKNIGLFSVCTVGEIKEIMTAVTKRHFDKGNIIIKQGEAGDFFFIIGQGDVSVSIDEKGRTMNKIATLKAGDYFGEISLLTGQVRNATIIADTPCELFLIYRTEFLGLLSRNPSLEVRFLKDVEKRLMERNYVMSHSQERKTGFFQKIKKTLGGNR